LARTKSKKVNLLKNKEQAKRENEAGFSGDKHNLPEKIVCHFGLIRQ